MAIKGAVLGDILGAQYEFDRPKDLDWKNVPLTIGDAIGFTDDSVMALAIKKALVEGKDLVETMVSVGREYPFCGYGGRFYNWINGQNHEPYNSWGNGSAMRCFYESDDYESFIRNVFSLECDSDTFGAIAGGVAEEFYKGFGKVDAEGILRKYLTPELWEIMNM